MAEVRGSASSLDVDQVVTLRSRLAPLYHSLGHIIRTRIESGEWPSDTQIPSERTLMETLGISRSTVRQGVENLVREGVLYRVHGRGTFVAQPKMKQGMLRLLSFTETMRRNGLNAQARLMGKAQLEPPADVRQKLELGAEQQAVWFQRLLSVNDTPMLIQTAYFPATRFPDLLAVYDGSEDPHRFVYRRYGVRIAREHEVFEPVILESREAAQLGVKSGFAALWVEHLAYDVTGAPAAFFTSLLRGDRCRFYIDLSSGRSSLSLSA